MGYNFLKLVEANTLEFRIIFKGFRLIYFLIDPQLRFLVMACD